MLLSQVRGHEIKILTIPLDKSMGEKAGCFDSKNLPIGLYFRTRNSCAVCPHDLPLFPLLILFIRT